MTMNALALVVTTVLVVVGVWLAVSIADMRKNQDCYLQGGRNCNQLADPDGALSRLIAPLCYIEFRARSTT